MYLHLISLLTFLMPDPKGDLPHSVEIIHKIKRESVPFVAHSCIDGRLRAGICTRIDKCSHVVEEFYVESRTGLHPIHFQTFISKSICGFDGINFLICCRIVSQDAIAAKDTPPVEISPANFVETTPFTFAPLDGDTSHTTASNNNLQAMIFPDSDFSVISLVGNIVTPTPTPEATAIPTDSTTTPHAIIQLIQQPSPITSEQSLTCGVNQGILNRVVGGTEARKGNYPWIAALAYRDEYDSRSVKYLCGGSLISPKYIITSAHCITNYLLFVRLGAHDLTNKVEQGARNYGIKRTIVHDKFDLKSITNDLALIRLNETVVMTDLIKTICLPDEPTFLLEDFVGMHPFLAGWGAQKHQGPTSNVLKDIQVPVIDRQECERNYSSAFNSIKFSDKIICAGNYMADACQGDSGGPLMMPQVSDSSYRYYLLGVVSFGYGCAHPGYPGVYTKVAAYIPWIRININEYS